MTWGRVLLCLLFFIFFVGLIRESVEVTCDVTENCSVYCSKKSLGPKAPNLSVILPSRCHGKTIPAMDLKENDIQSIPSNWLGGWEVRVLDLGRNRELSDVPVDAFGGQQCTLTKLYLHECALLVSKRNLSRDMFEGCSNSLSVLNLDGTLVTNTDLEALEPLKLLTQLHLYRNSLTSLREGVFNRMTNLRMLFLAQNAIKIAHYEEPFKGLTKLYFLNLTKNKLETVSFCSFGRIETLTTFLIRSNPIVCNCTVWWLKTTGFGSDTLAECWDTLEGQCDGYVLPDCDQRPQLTNNNNNNNNNNGNY